MEQMNYIKCCKEFKFVMIHRFLLTEQSNYIQYSFPSDPTYASLKHGRKDLLITRSDVIFRRTLEYTVN